MLFMLDYQDIVSFLDFLTKISNLKNKQFSWPNLIAQEENKLILI